MGIFVSKKKVFDLRDQHEGNHQESNDEQYDEDGEEHVIEENDQEKEEDDEDENKSEKEEENEDEDEHNEEENEEESQQINQDTTSSSNMLSGLSLAEMVQKALVGEFNIEYPENIKIVRIFTSSTFTDTSVERNTLMEKVYPKLKEFCQKRGYSFQVVDMRWGVRDEATDDHMTTELCMRELRACQKLSTGPNFITFLGQKYGYRPFPAKIEAEEFEKLLDAISNAEDKALLQRWFWRDANATPDVFVLQPIPTILKNYRAYDKPDLRKKDVDEWWTSFEKIQVVLRQAAGKALDKKASLRYIMSVTEDEIRRGIITASEPCKSCFWFKRVISDLKENINDKKAGSFMDKIWGKEGPDEEAQKYLNILREKDLPAILPKSNITQYDVKWSAEGIDPGKEPTHKAYIEKLSDDFYTTLTNMIASGIKEKADSDFSEGDNTSGEVFQHLNFCQKKCKAFHGRRDIIDSVKEKIENDGTVIVLQGVSGSGKTSLMAKIASELKDWCGDDSIIAVRFIGTTPESSSITSLLKGLCHQFYSILGKEIGKNGGNGVPDFPETFQELKGYFDECIRAVYKTYRKVVLVIDSLDQLSEESGGKQCTWIPLGGYVTMIVSTLPEPEYECLPSLQRVLVNESGASFIEVPQMPMGDARIILSAWQKQAGRTLTKPQEKVFYDAFEKCSYPLYMKLAFDETCRWESYTTPDETVLASSIRDIINALFERIERLHGKVPVSHALGYITASKSGLSETELEDILSLDDVVLNDVYQYWTPPVRRLPPLLWIRIRSDIGDYLVDRGADGTRVIFWYHRQFIEVAHERYLTEGKAEHFHRHLSEYFVGKWAGISKAYVTKDGKELSADRLVVKQPIRFESEENGKSLFNLRKLSELPYHLLKIKDAETLKKEVLCNFEFMLGKGMAFNSQVVLNDLIAFMDAFPDDNEVDLVRESFSLALYALSKDMSQLGGQLYGRLLDYRGKESEYPNICFLLKQIENSSTSVQFIPKTKALVCPGGALIHTLSAPEHRAEWVDISPDGKLVVTAARDKSVMENNIWELRSGILKKTLTFENPCPFINHCWHVSFFKTDPNMFVATGGEYLFIINIRLGQIVKEVKILEEGQIYPPPSPTPIALIDGDTSFVALTDTGLKKGSLNGGEIKTLVKFKADIWNDGVGILNANTEFTVYSLVTDKTAINVINNKTGASVRTIKKVFSDGKNVKFLRIISGNRMIVVPEGGKTMKMLDIQSGMLVKEFPEFTVFESSSQIDVSADGKKAICIPDIMGYEIKVLDLETGEYTEGPSNPSTSFHVFSKDGRYVLKLGYDGTVRVNDLNRHHPEEEASKKMAVPGYAGFQVMDQLTNVFPCGDGRHIVATAMVKMKQQIHVWDMHSGAVVCRTEVMMPPTKLAMRTATLGVGLIYLKDMKPYVNLRVYDFKTKKVAPILEGKAAPMMNIGENFSFIDDKHVISLSRGRRNLKIWDTTTGKLVDQLITGSKHKIVDFVISQNGKSVVCGYANDMETLSDKELPLLVYNTQTRTHNMLEMKGQQLQLAMYGRQAPVSNDGKYLFILTHKAEDFQFPAIWDLDSGTMKHKFVRKVEENNIDGVAIMLGISSESGLACCYYSNHEQNTMIWDIETGNPVRSLAMEQPRAIFISPDGYTMITSESDSLSFNIYCLKQARKLGGFTLENTPNNYFFMGKYLIAYSANDTTPTILQLQVPGSSPMEIGESPYGPSVDITLEMPEEPIDDSDPDKDKED